MPLAMIRERLRLKPGIIIFLGAFAVALLFALYTNHVWEDYYITYRSSKNLATGHGLVFNVGERLHTFTSPLGVLLPALSHLLTGNTSDTGALWIFRVMCAAAFGGAAMLLFRMARLQHGSGVIGGLLAAWLITDPKSVDFAINGMETAFMLLFLACTLWGHLATGPRSWRILGAAWAGLMWTRPDSFIYVALIAAGFWLFNDEKQSGTNRRGLLVLYFRAGLLTTALYLPWLIWAWAYYGTPIPHTITAKGDIGGVHTLMGLLGTAIQLPLLAWTKTSSLELTFLPSYYIIGGWPSFLIHASRALATVCCLLWLMPFIRHWSRAASFAFFGAHVYLTYFPYFPFPWYIPSTTLLALVALAGLIDWLLTRGVQYPRLRLAAWGLSGLLLAANMWTLWQVARQVEAQQTLVEDGTRRKIGEWLHEHSATGDTVFMEPLGYIGFFSNLKTYDWPGMSSLEMVHARQQVGSNWSTLIQYLEPTWLVLRPFEVERISLGAPRLLTESYRLVQAFDSSSAVAKLPVNGRPYLEHDANFIVYRQRRIPVGERSPVTLTRGEVRLRPGRMQLPGKAYHTEFNRHEITITGAPATIEFPVTPDLSELTGGFGLLDEEWVGTKKIKPVEFTITLIKPDGTGQILLQQQLDPVNQPDHRGFRPFRLSLPQPLAGILRFSTKPSAGSAGHIRAFWGELQVVPLRTGLLVNGRLIPAAAASKARFGFFNTEEDGQPCLFAHAPTALVYDWQEGMNRLEAEFGVMRAAHTGTNATEGVVFVVEVVDATGASQVLFRRHLNPLGKADDRGAQVLSVPLPPSPGGRIILRTDPPPSGHLNSAWSYWRNLKALR